MTEPNIILTLAKIKSPELWVVRENVEEFCFDELNVGSVHTSHTFNRFIDGPGGKGRLRGPLTQTAYFPKASREPIPPYDDMEIAKRSEIDLPKYNGRAKLDPYGRGKDLAEYAVRASSILIYDERAASADKSGSSIDRIIRTLADKLRSQFA